MSSQDNRSKNIRYITGTVVSDKMDKTRVVLVKTMKKHPLFRKAIKSSRRIKIHDEANKSKLGDVVQAIETRPLSRQKRHRLFKILETAK